jgi:hypothetical protein
MFNAALFLSAKPTDPAADRFLLVTDLNGTQPSPSTFDDGIIRTTKLVCPQ